MQDRQNKIFRITLLGSLINLLLVALKFAAGILGASAAMIADAVHSLSDLLTDFIVLIFVKISGKPADEDHPYGHGKFETLATTIIGIALLSVGALLLADGVGKILGWARGEALPLPGTIALWAALVSILFKELIYQGTIRVAKQVHSDALKANAWHHRTDALSSVGTALGIGGAILLGNRWAVLDPLAACVVSIFIIAAAAKLLRGALDQLMERRLPAEEEAKIRAIVAEDPTLEDLHRLRTRQIGSTYAITMHLRMPGSTPLDEAHHHSQMLEHRLREAFGPDTLINIHIEPIKVNGKYEFQSSIKDE